MPNDLPAYEQVRNDLNNAVISSEPAAFGKAPVEKFLKDPLEADNTAADTNINFASNYLRGMVGLNGNGSMESNARAQGAEQYRSLVTYGTDPEIKAFQRRRLSPS